MEPLWLAIAFVLGRGVRRLPPLAGYLVAGFVLHALGLEAGGFIDEAADIGVLLMLFSIGLNLQLRGGEAGIGLARHALDVAATSQAEPRESTRCGATV